MERITYRHESGLVFETARIVDPVGGDYDISTILLWMPNNADEPMKQVNYYFGEPTFETTKAYADEWVKTLSASDIVKYLELQDDPTGIREERADRAKVGGITRCKKQETLAAAPEYKSEGWYLNQLKQLSIVLQAMMIVPMHDIKIVVDNTEFEMYDRAAFVNELYNAVEYTIEDMK